MASYTPVSNVLDFSVALKPSSAFPLDPRTMFGSRTEALAAAATASDAGSTDTIYYFGQTVTVYENNVAKNYLIQPDANGVGTLVEILGLPEVTKADNGQVLKVVDGVWAADTDETGGGISPVVEPFSYSGTLGENQPFAVYIDGLTNDDIVEIMPYKHTTLTALKQMQAAQLTVENRNGPDVMLRVNGVAPGAVNWQMQAIIWGEANEGATIMSFNGDGVGQAGGSIEFADSNTIGFTKSGEKYVAEVFDGRIGLNKLSEEVKAQLGGGGGASSWNDLTDKPFGDIVYSDSYSFAVIPTAYFDFAGQSRFYKISDLCLTYDQLLKTEFTVGDEKTTPKAEEFLFANDSICGIMSNNIGIGVAYKTGSFSTDYGVLNIPQTGVYFGWPINATPPANLLVSFRCEDLKQIDAKYLPYANGNEVAY